MGLTGAGSLMAGGSKHTKPDKAELILNNKVGPYGYMENKKGQYMQLVRYLAEK